MGAISLRHWIWVVFIVAFSFIAFGAYSDELENQVWLAWIVGITFAAIILLFDCLFTQDNTFIYDPDPENWRRQTDPRF
eukprot:CAMPEP_0118857728 /NCGR_PEP_ID=MMETSP1163-20130328/4699_1 /TAXON_ID=124430 /ORGANISM="Phaeomonas parva, Strain CCMP2877" /LENGTH=78 /DNA_ID=CAMNT_0006791067 /DNA_START=191 /DNA_END=427 /DNA_ORIENTATION=+